MNHLSERKGSQKICILTSVHHIFDRRIFHKEAKTLLNVGYTVALIAQHDKNEIVDGIKIIALPKPRNRFERMTKTTWLILKLALKDGADFYHFHDPELMPVGVLLKLFSRKKIIYDVHEDYCKQILSKSYIPMIFRNSIALLVKTSEYIFSKFYDGIITATDDILENFSTHKKAVSVKNFPIMSTFNLSRMNNDISVDTFNLVYVGGLSPVRGIVEIVNALEFVDCSRKVKLTLYGKFETKNFETKIRSLKGFTNVDYNGWIEPEKVPKLLTTMDVGLVCLHPAPNYLTSLSVKLFEYMAASIPVIASNFPLWQEIVEQNGCGLCVDPLNSVKIARCIEHLCENHGERKQMGENGRSAVLEKFTWERESKKLLNIYEQLMKK